MHMKTVFCVTKKEACQRASFTLSTLLTGIKKKQQSVLLLLSGGSSFDVLRELDHSVMGPHCTVGVLDERYSKNDEENNFMQLMKTNFYGEALAAGSVFIDTRVRDGETLEELRSRFEEGIIDWERNNKTGVVVATMGVGADGHTAGIMPFPEDEATFHRLFDDEQTGAAAYDATGKNPYPMRVTVTLSFLRSMVDHAICFAAGEEKKEAIERLLASSGTLAETPARIMREMKSATLYSDHTAA